MQAVITQIRLWHTEKSWVDGYLDLLPEQGFQLQKCFCCECVLAYLMIMRSKLISTLSSFLLGQNPLPSNLSIMLVFHYIAISH